MSRKSQGSVSADLEKALADELKEVTRKYKKSDTIPEGKKEGDFIHSSTDRMRILDRCLKLEGLKLKVDDPGYGGNFGKDEDEK